MLTKKAFLMAIFLIAVIGCGRRVEIQYHWDVPPDDLFRICNQQGVMGCADWNDNHLTQERTCNIYLASQQLYGTRECFEATLEHERRHCYDGKWHGDVPKSEPACGERSLI